MTSSAPAEQIGQREGWWQLRIELLDVRPSVWRRLIVPETMTLSRLHTVLQGCMGWGNRHLHEFLINGVPFSAGDPDAAEDTEEAQERSILLPQALGMETRCFDYLYDFGAEWHHVLVLEDRYAAAAGIQCVAGENACPPEDVGGAMGYASFLRILLDPQHPEYAEQVRIAGGTFDPTAFDLARVNRALARMKD